MSKDKGKKKANPRPTRTKIYNSTIPDAFGSSLAFKGLAGILFLGIIIYSNSFESTFHLDDMVNIRENGAIRSLTNFDAMWEFSRTRFLALYSFAWNYHYGQLNVWGYHFVNLLIHLINAFLVYWLSFLIFSTPILKDKFMLKDKTILSMAITFLFLTHPLATQSVTYIVQRMTSMSALFYFLGLVLYLLSRFTEKGRPLKTRLLIGCALSAILAMLTKEIAFTFPFAIVLLELCFFQSNQQSFSFKDKRVLAIGAALLILIAIGFYRYWDVLTTPQFADQDVDTGSITALTYLMTQFSVILKYIQLLILPINQVLDYNYPLVTSFSDMRAWLPLLVLLALVAVAVLTFKKHRIISFGIFWFFITLSIESSIIPIKDVIFEHRTYLPSFGFFLILVYGIYSLAWKKYYTLAIAFLGTLILTYSVLTYMRNNVWKDEITLSTDSIRKSPGKARPYNNRGDAYVDKNKMDEAFNDFNTALTIHPKYFMAYYNRGNMYKKQKKFDLALADFSSAIQYQPDFDKAYNNRGSIYKELNRLDEALTDYNRAIELNPSYAMPYNNRGTIYILKGQYPLAIEDLDRAMALNPGFGEALANRGIARIQTGNTEGCEDLKNAAAMGFAPAGEAFRQRCSQK